MKVHFAFIWEGRLFEVDLCKYLVISQWSEGNSWFWIWNSNTLATTCKELTHWKRPWCWEGLGAGGEGDDRGWDGWMPSPTWWTRVWVNSGSWCWTGRPGVLRFMGSQRVGQDWATEMNWTVFYATTSLCTLASVGAIREEPSFPFASKSP